MFESNTRNLNHERQNGCWCSILCVYKAELQEAAEVNLYIILYYSTFGINQEGNHHRIIDSALFALPSRKIRTLGEISKIKAVAMRSLNLSLLSHFCTVAFSYAVPASPVKRERGPNDPSDASDPPSSFDPFNPASPLTPDDTEFEITKVPSLFDDQGVNSDFEYIIAVWKSNREIQMAIRAHQLQYPEVSFYDTAKYVISREQMLWLREQVKIGARKGLRLGYDRETIYAALLGALPEPKVNGDREEDYFSTDKYYTSETYYGLTYEEAQKIVQETAEEILTDSGEENQF